MAKIIKYNDFVQINPDNRILSLDKKEKVDIIDHMLQRSYNGGKGLVITYDLSHSGRRINNRIYSTKGQQRGIDSLTNPYQKPILKNHNQSGEPIGRFIGGEWQNLYDEASYFLQSNQAALDIQNAFADDEPEKIYKTLKAFNLIDNKEWPGLGRMRVQANITDEEAIKKFMDGRYLTFSAGSTTDRHVCSICDTDWAKDGMCEHRHGKKYDGETCVFITGDFIVLEGSVVNTPADDLSQIISMEMQDHDNNFTLPMTDYSQKEILMTDSIYMIGDSNGTSQNGLQATEQVDAQEKEEEDQKEEEIVDKKYDHQMTISEKAMMELHESGETYITQRGGNETMIIKVNYSGAMRKDSLLNIEEELDQFAEELNDERTFKVPSGAKGNAQKVLDWKSKYGSDVKGMTPVGWARARQLASKSEIGLSTVKRMAAFNRHRKNAEVAPEYKSEPWKDRGYVAWLGWGGTTGIDWAIKISAANDSTNPDNYKSSRNPAVTALHEEAIESGEDAYRSPPKGKGAKTPAKPSERIKGSKKNKKGSASKSNSKIEVGSVLETLKEKVSSHNKKYGKEKGKRVSLGMLKAVYRRGAGAFSSTHRPGMSRSGWGVARVNAFLKLVRSGRPSNPKYKQDNDLLPAGHPRKSSNKSNKDFIMEKEEKLLEEAEVLEVVDSEDEDLLEEAQEPTQEQQQKHDESFDEETLDAEDSDAIDWHILDLALQGFIIGSDAALTTEQRNELPDSAFCGPERSFPVPDCAHVTAARRLIGRAKVSDSTKQKILACVNKKAEGFSCDKSEDFLKLQQQFDALQAQYEDLQNKFLVVLDKMTEKQEEVLVENDEKNVETVENTQTDAVEVNDEKIFSIEDKEVTSPSVHSEEEERMVKEFDNLGDFEKKVVKQYKEILNNDGEYSANLFLQSKASYLPRGFNPNNF